MERSLFMWEKEEPDVVFQNLEWTRVKIKLKDDDRKKTIVDIEEVLKQINEDFKKLVLLLIAYAIQQELFKSKEIDMQIIQNLASWFPRCVEIDDDEKEDERWLNDDFKLSPDTDNEDDDEDDDDDDADDEDGDAADEGDDGEEEKADDMVMLPRWEEVEEEEEEVDLKKIEASMKKFEEADINEFKKQCHVIGCSWKQGQEKQILDAMISFFAAHNFRVDSEERMQISVEHFMSRVKCYISSTCTLEDLGTVKTAIRSVEMH